MRFYELTYITLPDLSEIELKSLEEEVSSSIQKEGGLIKEINPTFKKKLAFPIKKNKEAFLVNLFFHLAPDKLPSLEKKLKSEKKILRYLILSKSLPKKIPLPIRPEKFIKPKTKVELKEIEKKLEEILGE